MKPNLGKTLENENYIAYRDMPAENLSVVLLPCHPLFIVRN